MGKHQIQPERADPGLYGRTYLARRSFQARTICLLLTRANKERRTGKIRGAFFRNAQGFGRLDDGSRVGFTSSRPPPPWTSVFQFSLSLYDVWP